MNLVEILKHNNYKESPSTPGYFYSESEEMWLHVDDGALITNGQYTGYFVSSDKVVTTVDGWIVHFSDDQLVRSRDENYRIIYGLAGVTPQFIKVYSSNPYYESWAHKDTVQQVALNDRCKVTSSSWIVGLDGEKYYSEGALAVAGQQVYKYPGDDDAKEFIDKINHLETRHITSNNSHQRWWHRYGTVDMRDLSNGYPQFNFGFEAEKDSWAALSSQHCDVTYCKTGYRVETDRSIARLDEHGNPLYDGTYEVISPILDLMDNAYINQSLSHPDIKTLLNAKTNPKCGGHMHVSEQGKSAKQLLEDVSGYFPLLYAMFPTRVEGRYTKAEPKQQYLDRRAARGLSPDHHYAIVTTEAGTLELRIFSSIKSVNHLKRRIKFLQWMMTNQTPNPAEVFEMCLNTNSYLHKYLKRSYKTTEKLMAKMYQFAYYAYSIDGVRLDVERFRPLIEDCCGDDDTLATKTIQTLATI